MIFGKKGNGSMPTMDGYETITFAEAGQADRDFTGTDSSLDYSDHRAVRVHIHY
jgi:hypothetical protein